MPAWSMQLCNYAIIPPKCGIWRSVISITTFYIGVQRQTREIDVITNERERVNIAVVQPSSYGCTREVAKYEKIVMLIVKNLLRRLIRLLLTFSQY